MARTMSSSEAEHDCRVLESCSRGGKGEVCSGHQHPRHSQQGHPAKQFEIGRLGDENCQGLREKGLVMQPGDEALMETATGSGQE